MQSDENLLLMIIGDKERELVKMRAALRAAQDQIKTLQAAVSEMQKSAKADPPHPGS
jgi:uncharacterized coiled-coil protein SlyX